MKNRFLIKAITIAFLMGQWYALNAQLWERVHDLDIPTPYQLIQVSDGGFLIVGSVYDTVTMERRGFLFKADEEGNEQWETTWNGAIRSVGNAVTESSDGDYLVAGTDIVPSVMNDAAVRKFANDGTLVWEQKYSTGDFSSSQLRSIANVGEDHYMVLGTADALEERAWMFKINGEGDMVWQREFTDIDENIYGRVVKQTMEEGFILLIADNSANPPSFLVIKTDSIGMEEWRTQVEKDGQRIDPHNIFQESDGTFIATAVYHMSPGFREHWMLKLDVDGNLLWKKIISDGNDPGVQSTRTQDGNYVLLEDISGLKIIKADTSGTVLWTKKITDNPEFLFAADIVQSSDGGFVVTGQYGSGEDRDLFLIKGDSIGAVVYDYERIENLNIDFSIYPNPVKDWATLEITSMGLFASVRFRLYDLNGRKVYAENLTSSQTSIQFPNNLPAEAYVGVLEVDGKKQIGRIIYLE